MGVLVIRERPCVRNVTMPNGVLCATLKYRIIVLLSAGAVIGLKRMTDRWTSVPASGIRPVDSL